MRVTEVIFSWEEIIPWLGQRSVDLFGGHSADHDIQIYKIFLTIVNKMADQSDELINRVWSRTSAVFLPYRPIIFYNNYISSLLWPENFYFPIIPT